jgi:hypothetical protein
MERRFAARMQEALEGAIVDPRVFRDVQPRLENFLEPFVACLREAEQKEHAQSYVTGLLSDLKRKTARRRRHQNTVSSAASAPWSRGCLIFKIAELTGSWVGASILLRRHNGQNIYHLRT